MESMSFPTSKKSITVSFPLYLQTRLTLPLSVILHLSYTFSLALHWLACWCPSGSWSNNNCEIALQSAPNLKFTITSVSLSKPYQSSWEGQSPLDFNRNVRNKHPYHFLLIQPWHASFSLQNPAFSFSKHMQNGLSSCSGHKFCQKQDKILRSEKCHKIYTVFPSIQTWIWSWLMLQGMFNCSGCFKVLIVEVTMCEAGTKFRVKEALRCMCGVRHNFLRCQKFNFWFVC